MVTTTTAQDVAAADTPDGDAASGPVGRTWPGALAIGAAAAVLYRLTLSAVPALTHDSIGYMFAIEAGGDALWHPHHLAYNALARGWLDLCRAVGVGGDPLRIVSSLNALLGGCAVALVWLVLRVRARLSPALCAAGSGGAALSYGVWFYSASVEVYILPLVLLLTTLLLVTAPSLSTRAMLGVGLANGLAVLAHQVNVLFAIVVLAVAVRGVDRTVARRRVVAYGSAATAVVVGAYAAVLGLAVRPGTTGGAADWFTAYAQTASNWHLGPLTPVKALTGFARSLVAGHFAYRLAPVRDRVTSTFAGKSLDDEAFLVRNLPAGLAVVLIAVAVAGAALLAVAVVRGLQRRRDLPSPARLMVRPLVVWLAVYAAFFTVWDPLNPEFWIPQATVVWMLAAVVSPDGASSTAIGGDPGAPRPRARRSALLVVAAAAIGGANLLGSIVPATDAANDVYALRYATLGRQLDAGAVVLVDHPHLGLGYAERFTEAEPVPAFEYRYVVTQDEPRDPPPRELIARLDTALAGGHPIAIDADLVDKPTDRTEALRAELVGHFGPRWRSLPVPGAAGWFVVDP
jgi:hypothetical protein